jgi:hypothetical protein
MVVRFAENQYLLALNAALVGIADPRPEPHIREIEEHSFLEARYFFARL